jgi:hypothetical protein
MQLTQDLREPKGRKVGQATDQNALPKEVEQTLGMSNLERSLTWKGLRLLFLLQGESKKPMAELLWILGLQRSVRKGSWPPQLKLE